MNYARFKSVVAAFALVAALGAAAPICPAGEVEACSNDCSGYWSNCCVCRCCDRTCWGLDRICHFQLIDGCTKCAWHRTWHAPYAPATPLRQYYIPRPPQCCWTYGCEPCMANPGTPAWDMVGDTNCQNRTTAASSQISPEAF